jgi:predicted RecB family nuclease
MLSKITNDVLNAQVHCRLKAHLRLSGEGGVQCDFEKLVFDQRQELRAKAIAKIRRRYRNGEVATDVPLSIAALRTGISFILDSHLEDDRYFIRFDGLRRVDGVSTLGDFQYEPVIFSEARRARNPDRHLLSALAVLLSRIQGAIPTNGVLCLGRDCAMTSIRLPASLRAAEDTLRDAERMQRAETPPKLLLNDHCGICEFRDRCRAKAIQEDNLSLLRGLSDKTIKRYARKGLFTLTQLAHTFRPRRRGKRSDQPLSGRDHALHALAIRDKMIYVLGKPEVPIRPVRIYLDIEGSLDQDFIYLIGMVISDGENLDSYPFGPTIRNRKRPFSISFSELYRATTRRRYIAMVVTKRPLSFGCVDI